MRRFLFFFSLFSQLRFHHCDQRFIIGLRGGGCKGIAVLNVSRGQSLLHEHIKIFCHKAFRIQRQAQNNMVAVIGDKNITVFIFTQRLAGIGKTGR